MDNIIDLLRMNVFYSLLKNDCAIYGSFLFKLFHTEDVLKCLDESNIYVIANSQYKNIIERDLYDYILKKTSVSNEIILYSVNYCGSLFTIEITYRMSIRLYFDIKNPLFKEELIFLNRNGLQTMPCLYNVIENPLPFFDVLKNINNKLFTLIKNNKELTNYDITMINYLKSQGWLNTKTTLTYFTPTEDTQCSICYENNKTKFMRLSCGHSFHNKCWSEMVKNYIEQKKHLADGLIQCPYCRYKFDIKNIL